MGWCVGECVALASGLRVLLLIALCFYSSLARIHAETISALLLPLLPLLPLFPLSLFFASGVLAVAPSRFVRAVAGGRRRVLHAQLAWNCHAVPRGYFGRHAHVHTRLCMCLCVRMAEEVTTSYRSLVLREGRFRGQMPPPSASAFLCRGSYTVRGVNYPSPSVPHSRGCLLMSFKAAQGPPHTICRYHATNFLRHFATLFRDTTDGLLVCVLSRPRLLHAVCAADRVTPARPRPSRAARARRRRPTRVKQRTNAARTRTLVHRRRLWSLLRMHRSFFFFALRYLSRCSDEVSGVDQLS